MAADDPSVLFSSVAVIICLILKVAIRVTGEIPWHKAHPEKMRRGIGGLWKTLGLSRPIFLRVSTLSAAVIHI